MICTGNFRRSFYLLLLIVKLRENPIRRGLNFEVMPLLALNARERHRLSGFLDVFAAEQNPFGSHPIDAQVDRILCADLAQMEINLAVVEWSRLGCGIKVSFGNEVLSFCSLEAEGHHFV